MNAKDIYDGVTDIRDDLIDGAKAAPEKPKRRKKAWWFGVVAAILVLAVLGGTFFRPGGGETPGEAQTSVNGQTSDELQTSNGMQTSNEVQMSGEAQMSGENLPTYALAVAKYPQMAPYPKDDDAQAYNAWRESVRAQQRDLGDVSALQTFFRNSTATFLSDADGQNKVYSPLNVYMALSMLAQLTGGESRGQILTLLGSDSMDALRRQASDVWNANYRDDGALTSILASSVWMNQEIDYNQETMDVLARDFYASSYRGKMGSDEYNDALQEWLDRQTGGLLTEQARQIEMDRDTVLALATTVYFKAKWTDEFSEKETSRQTFHGPQGDVETDFLHQSNEQYYYWGDKFSAVCQDFTEGGEMWFLLPDEGVTPEELLADEEAMKFLFARDEWENKTDLLVNKAIPKFDVSSQFDLQDGLERLGVTDVFDRTKADFSAMTTDVDGYPYLKVANHASRVTIDEKGCTAAAFTVMIAITESVPSEKVDFVLDRPFLFCITGDSGLPLFVGVVNTP